MAIHPIEKDEIDIGHAIYVKWSGSQITMRTSDKKDHIFVNAQDVRAIIRFFKENGVDIDDNDKGTGGKADYLTVDPDKMAKEIVFSDPLRGVFLAQALYRRVGWVGPKISGGILTYSLSSPPISDKLQPKVPVDTGRDGRTGTIEDHYPR